MDVTKLVYVLGVVRRFYATLMETGFNMSEFKYKIMADYDLTGCEPVKELVSVVNEWMSGFDLPKIGVKSTICLGTMTVTKELTQEAKDIAIGVMNKQFTESVALSKKFKVVDLVKED